MDNKNLEILAPAGSLESAIAAVRANANAIYLGYKNFSARASAQNFDDLQLKQVVEFCHARNVKVYLALNTLINDIELPDAINIIKQACSLPIDALIVQDTGLAFAVKKICPTLPLHASTQMAVHTPQGAKTLYDFGFKRIVLARELSKSQIKEIVDSCPIEVEVFVHGALCMCVSGNCYLSAVIGQRSGNRGKCAQPCRLPFKVSGGNGYDLSLKDMSLIKYINELKKIGVHSLKIEGRMKRPEYVYSAVDACSSVLENGFLKSEKEKILNDVFSRSGFTDGYYKNKIDKTMYGVREKENVLTATNKLLNEIGNKYKNEKQLIKIDLSISILQDKEIKLVATDSNNNFFEAYSEKPQIAQNIALSKDKIINSLSKTGNTQFYVDDVNIDMENGLTVPISVLNNLRRNVLSGLSDVIAKRQKIEVNDIDLTIPKTREIKPYQQKLRAVFYDTNIPDCYKACEIIYVPLFSKENDIKSLIEQGFNVGVTLPRGMFGIEDKIVKALTSIKRIGVINVLVGNIGAIELAKNLGFNVSGDFTLNVFNTHSANMLSTLGLSDYVVSIELKVNQINNLNANIPKGVIVYGHLPLMTMRNCPQNNGANLCKTCKLTNKKIPVIKDRKKEQFPLICDGNTTSLINSVPLNIMDKTQDFETVDFVVIHSTVDNYVDRVNIFNEYTQKNSVIKSKKSRFTRGLYYRGVY